MILLRRASLLGALATLNLGIGFAFHWLPVVRLGAGASTDAYLFSATVPQVVLSIAALGVTPVLTPVLATRSHSSFTVLAWTCAIGVSVAALAINGVLYMTAPAWVRWLAPGFALETQALTVGLVRLQLVATALTGLLAVTWAACYARERFVHVELAGIAAGAIGLIVLWSTIGTFGVRGAAWALVVRASVQVMLLLPALGRYARPQWQLAEVGTVARRWLTLSAGSVLYKADPLVERWLASYAPAGQLSLFHLASQIYAAGQQLVTKALINPIVPELARLAEAHEREQFVRLSLRRMLAVSILCLGASVVILLGAGVMSRLILGPRAAEPDLSILPALLIVLSGFWIGGASGQVMASSFLAAGDARTPTVVGAIGLILGIPLRVFGFWHWGVVGLASASSVVALATALGYARTLRRRVLPSPRRS
jgi:peptidoglycan biosynthesis protein MviN/MurJ (putative lipid II flippase)